MRSRAAGLSARLIGSIQPALHQPLEHTAEEGQKVGALARTELVRVFGPHDQEARQTALAQIEVQQGLGFDPGRVGAENARAAVANLAQRHLTMRDGTAAGDVILDKAGGDDGQHILQLLHMWRGGFRGLGAFQNQAHTVHAQRAGHVIGQRLEKGGELGLVQQGQDRPVDLVGPRQVFIGRRDDGSVGVFQTVQPVFQPLHRDTAHVDNVSAHLPVIGRDERPHQVAVVQDQIRVAQDAVTPIVGIGGQFIGLDAAHGYRPRVRFLVARELTSVSQDFLPCLFPILEECVQTFVGQNVIGHGFDHCGWRCGHICAQQGGLFHVVCGADRGCEYFCGEVVIVIDRADFCDQFHAVDVEIIQAPHERRNERRTRFCRQKRLIGRKTQGHVHHATLAGQNLARLQAIPGQRHLDRDVVRDLGQFAALCDHAVRIQRHGFCRDGAGDHVADLFRHFLDVATRLHDQRRVRRDTVDHAQFVQFPDRIDICGIHKEFHGLTSFHGGAVVFCPPSTSGARGHKEMTDSYFEEGSLVGVLTAEPLDRVLDYRAPEGGCWLGSFVEVPLGPRKVLGVIWGPGKGDWDIAKVRHVIRVLDAAPMREELRIFLEKAGAYTLTPMSAMLRLATRVPGLSDPPWMRKIYRLGRGEPDRVTDARRRVIETLTEYGGLGFTLKELSDLAGVTSSVVKGLAQMGVVEEADTPRDAPYLPLDPDLPAKTLTEDQAAAADALRDGLRQRRYGTTLLKGVTGSGKTEVYLEAVAECLRAGRQALVLLPEIALTSEFLSRVRARFGAEPAEWHSGVTMTERRRAWKMVGQGAAQLVVGARSSLFLPFQDLGLIVVDEEHDSSYKQEEGVLYNARDMAVLRASLCDARVVLASATPSLESWANAAAGKYTRLDLSSRFGDAVLPQMRISEP